MTRSPRPVPRLPARARWRSARAPWTTALLVVLVTACGAPAITPEPAPEPAPPPVRDADVLTTPWIPERAAGTFVHEVRLTSVLESRVDTVTRFDSVHTLAAAEWSRLAGGTRLSGLLTRFELARDTAPPITAPGVLLPLPFSGDLGALGTQVRLASDAAPACAPISAALASLGEAFITLPARLEAGMTWGDSSTYSVCRDSIPLVVSSRREFRVTGAERRGEDIIVLVERRTTLTITGSGHQFGEAIEISAEGDATAQLSVRLRGAIVVDGSGTSELRMTMRGRRRTQELRQLTQLEILSP